MAQQKYHPQTNRALKTKFQRKNSWIENEDKRKGFKTIGHFVKADKLYCQTKALHSLRASESDHFSFALWCPSKRTLKSKRYFFHSGASWAKIMDIVLRLSEEIRVYFNWALFCRAPTALSPIRWSLICKVLLIGWVLG